ncbi:hypothetical protein ACFX2I_030408 [Malus domestica]
MKVPKLPGARGIATLLTVGVVGGLGLYGLNNSLYNVMEGIVESKAGSRDLQMVLVELRVLTRPVSDELPTVYRTLEKAANFNIALDDVSITNLTFGKEFLNAIEAKQVAAQEAERVKFVVEKAEQDKKSAVIKAEGEATSAKLISQVIANNPAFITPRKIEAAREIARVISDSKNKIYLNADELLLNIQETNVQ